jgi:hypothetical protein
VWSALLSIQRTLRIPIADVLVPLNTIRLRDQPMAFDPVVPVMRHRAVFLSSLVELGRNAAH